MVIRASVRNDAAEAVDNCPFLTVMPNGNRFRSVGQNHDLIRPEPVDTHVQNLVGAFDAATNDMRVGAKHVLSRLDHRSRANVLCQCRVLFQANDGHIIHGDTDSPGGIIHEAREPVFDLGHGAAHPGGGGHNNGNQHHKTEHD